MHKSSYDKMANFKTKFLLSKKDKKIVIYDIGSCNVNGTYKQIFNESNWEYIGVDMEKGDNVDIVIEEPYSWKQIRSNSADVVISGQAFEHIEYPWLSILEIYRILKPGGLCCIIAPSNGFEHKYPLDCWRFYPDGFKSLAKLAKLDVLDVYTQWADDYYTDGSNVWKDSVLICQKKHTSYFMEIKQYVKRKTLNYFTKI